MPAQSQQQQKLFGLALAFKRGEVPASEVSDEIKDIADRMSEKEIEDFAATKHKGLPKMKEQLRKIVREIMRERAISEIELSKDDMEKLHSDGEVEVDGEKVTFEEGKKRFRQQDGIGKAKYTISYHDGKQKHKDGSDFFGIQIFKNKKDLETFRNALLKKGYIEESVNEGNVKLSSSAKKFWTTPTKKLFGGGYNLYDTIPPSQWNTHPEIIDGFGEDAGVDIFKGFIRDNIDGKGYLNSKIAKMIGLPTNVSIIDYLNDGGSGLNGNKEFKKYGNWFSALYDIYEEMEKKFGKMKAESVNEARTVSKPIKVDDDTMVQIVGDNKGFRELTAALNPKTGKPIQKFGYERGNEIADSKEELIKKLQKKYGKSIKFESVNEARVSIEAASVANLTGTRNLAVQDFIDAHNLDARKLYKHIKSGSLKDRMEFVTALAGKPGNPIQTKVIKMFGESVVNEGYSTEEKRIVMMAVRKLAKYRNVPINQSINDLLGAGQELERDIKKGKITK